MKSIAQMTNAELAALIQSRLREKGIETILSGGACVAIYSSNKYVSDDLDLVIAYRAKGHDIRITMEELGFSEENRFFKHPEADFFVEFLPGPLSIGAEPVREIAEQRLSTGVLKLLSPTDCVKDRLAAYYHWNDRQGLEQARLVAGAHDIDLAEIERWSEVEGKLEEFKRIQFELSD